MKREPRHLHMRVNGIRKAMQKELAEQMKVYGLSGGHIYYLLSLKDGPPEGATLKELSATCANNKARTTRVVADLEEKGYAKREYEAGMQKKFRIRLTEEGQAVAQEIQHTMQRQHEQMFSCLSDEEYEELLRLLQKICDHLRNASSN